MLAARNSVLTELQEGETMNISKPGMIGLSRGILFLLLSVMLGIAYLDYATDKNVVVWGLYLLPVGIASWLGGMRAGVALSLLGCVLMYVAGLYGGTRFDGTGYFLLGIFNRLLALLLVSWLASHLFRKQMLESTLESYEACFDYLHASPKSGAKHEGGNVGKDDSKR
ncbi:MAG: DUF4118 domain-containing protein [Thiobacillus sp.]|nr:DUF4118 domain-containing protein [Thiobacillus sp.]